MLKKIQDFSKIGVRMKNLLMIALNEEEDMIKILTSYSTRKFNDWDWKKNFKSIEEAMEFLLGHLENNRQLWVLTLQQNKDLIKNS